MELGYEPCSLGAAFENNFVLTCRLVSTHAGLTFGQETQTAVELIRAISFRYNFHDPCSYLSTVDTIAVILNPYYGMEDAGRGTWESPKSVREQFHPGMT